MRQPNHVRRAAGTHLSTSTRPATCGQSHLWGGCSIERSIAETVHTSVAHLRVCAEQIEVSGFLPAKSRSQSPYQEARSPVGGFWRCGKLRAKFLAESVWDLKKDLQTVSSDLIIRTGSVRDVVSSVLESYKAREDADVHGLWMTSEEGWEEKREEAAVKDLLQSEDKEFKLFTDEKYFVDE
ncbi:hypothetical protein MRB53_038372 [Persea americana]|nr:hypothetical protein MRB53_038372 [Persea americana]